VKVVWWIRTSIPTFSYRQMFNRHCGAYRCSPSPADTWVDIKPVERARYCIYILEASLARDVRWRSTAKVAVTLTLRLNLPNRSLDLLGLSPSELGR